MYSELIYTRCRRGIDVLRAGRPITGEGFKVYACAPPLLEGGKTDLPFLLSAAQAKPPCSEPSFMDDAYLYYVPDKGESMMVNFHPIPCDAAAPAGGYAHRTGNFINHIITGDFSAFYPFELFGDPAVWTAKARGEAYYYENPPAELPPRTDIGDPPGQLGFEEIGAFIADGRQDALMSAVAFLIAQYELPPEKRKFLVIREESAENVELWIAAIECAFSPRMAAALPFATRMDRFVMANRYTVNPLGAFQTQINLRDKSQSLRWRAMIVGVDERDRANAAAARPQSGTSFVLLEGKAKRALFEANTGEAYFRFITGFNEAHQSFCRDFLQTLQITAPTAAVYPLLEIFQAFEGAELPGAEAMAGMTAVLSGFRLLNSDRLQNIRGRLTTELPRFFREDPPSALGIVRWLQTAAQASADAGADRRLTDIVCQAFTEQVYQKADSESAFRFWERLKNSEFALSAAGFFTDGATLRANQACLSQMAYQDALAFVLIYLACAARLETVRDRDLQSVVNWGLRHCFSQGDDEAAGLILGALAQNRGCTVPDMLLPLADGADKNYEEFIMSLLARRHRQR